jgi:hypothetical protein
MAAGPEGEPPLKWPYGHLKGGHLQGLQGVKGWGMVGPSDTLRSPWPPLVIHLIATNSSSA